MPWAARRRAMYLGGVILFFAVVVGAPALYLWYEGIPTACPAGTLRPQGATSGPCSVLDLRYLQPTAVMWARSFKVRDGSYTAVAYVENPNPGAGVAVARYRFGFYDAQNVLITERVGQTFIMPGGITPVLETNIDTGNRDVIHTYFEFTDSPLSWSRMASPASGVKVTNISISGGDSAPRISAQVQNTSYDTMRGISFVAVVFDTAGNAFAASGTTLENLAPGASAPIEFVWPGAFSSQVGRVDIIPLLPPSPAAD